MAIQMQGPFHGQHGTTTTQPAARGRVARAAEVGEPTRAPAPPSGRRRRRRKSSATIGWISAILSLVFVFLAASAVGWAWFRANVTTPGPLAEPRAFKIDRGEGPRGIATRLQAAGVISSETLFMAHYLSQNGLARLAGTVKPLQMKAGDYEFEPGASIEAVMEVIDSGRSTPRFMTFPEGRTTYAILERIKADGRLEGDITEVPGEGELLPATYDVERGMARQDLVDRMREEHRKMISELWAARAENLPIKTPAEAIVLASIVQREMGPKDDPERIAAVFHNRLRKGMRLQSDPTILYGLYGGAVSWGKPIYQTEIAAKNAHNTYQIDGLPPTPICNPGKEALRAVLQPAKTEDLYFVADGKGGHIFAKTLKEHQANTRQWRKVERDLRARQAARKEAEAAAVPTSAPPGVAMEAPPTQPGMRPDQPVPAQTTAVTSKPVATVSISKPEAPAVGDGPVPLPTRKPKRE